MANQNKIALPVAKRLPKYYRYVNEMIKNGIDKISSREFAKLMGTTASQVRQDFSCFGGLGQQGIGYSTLKLKAELEKLIFNGKTLNTILIGVGSLGNTISKWITSERQGHKLIAAFDTNKDIIGGDVCGTKIYDINDLPNFINSNRVDIAVLCIPRNVAKEISPVLVELGITCFWNFSHYDLSINNPNIHVENVHLGDSLLTLALLANNE